MSEFQRKDDSEGMRFNAIVSRRDGRRFKAKLALRGETFSNWLRRMIKEFLGEED